MVASTVSSKMIEQMAEVENFKFVECLTGEVLFQGFDSLLILIGFKFIGNTALNLVSEGYEVSYS